MNRIVLSVLISLIVCVPAICGSSSVPVPDVKWKKLVPYIEANLRVEYTDGAVTVGASGSPFERQLFEPFDEGLGEFATILLIEGMTTKDVGRAVEASIRSIRESGFDVAAATRDDLISHFWKELRSDARFIGGLKELFAEAAAKGQLSCSICEQGFTPKHLASRTE